VPFVDERCAELVFRKKVLEILKDEGLLSEEREQLLLSWRHRTGFSVDASVKIEPEDEAAVQRLARYILRPPVSLMRMVWEEGSARTKGSRGPCTSPSPLRPPAPDLRVELSCWVHVTSGRSPA
jgi:hypothetical protein